MKGDFSKWDFDGKKNFCGVLHQQGRVLLDTDWNAQTRITNNWQDQAGRDAIGPGVAAIPASEPNGFKVVKAEVVSSPDGEKAKIGVISGRAWADGLLVYLVEEAEVTRTATYLQPPASPIASGIRDAVILEVWREAINGFQMPDDLIEPALGGPDTTERLHTAMAFRLLRLEEGDTCENIREKLKDDLSNRGELKVTLQPVTEIDGECPVVEGGGFTGFEHCLYRIEIAQVKSSIPMFKWSQFNGGLVGRGKFDPVTKKVTITANMQAIITSGLNEFYLEAVEYNDESGHWEVTYGAKATLNSDNEIELSDTETFGALPSSGKAVFFRLWNGIEDISDFPPSTSSKKAKTLVNGIRLEFDISGGTSYMPGDYWTFDLRVGGIGNPPVSTPVFNLSTALETDLNGETNSSALQTEFNNNGFPISNNATVEKKETGKWLITDPDIEETFAVRKEGSLLNVYHLNLIKIGPPEGIRYHRVPLAILNWDSNEIGEDRIDDCRDIFRPLTSQTVCCSFIVGDGKSTHGDFDSIEEALSHLPDSGGEICLLPGVHDANAVIEGKHDIKVRGCDKKTLVRPKDKKKPVFKVIDSQCITLENMDMVTLGGTAIDLRGAKKLKEADLSALQEIKIRNNRIQACENAIHVDQGVDLNAEQGKGIYICNNIIRILDNKGAGVGIYIKAEDSLVERNDIGVVPAESVPPVSTPGGDVPLPPTEECAEEEVIYANIPYFTTYVNLIWTLPVNLTPTVQFKALGGIQIAGGSERIKVIENRINGGKWNGITLGDVPLEDTETYKEIREKYGLAELSLERLKALQDTFESFLNDISIEGNGIRNMGLNGIGVVGFFSLENIALIVSVEDLTIYRNHIEDCLQQMPDKISTIMKMEMGFGGISLADCENLIIRENRIENNGKSHLEPVSGIFVLHGEKIDISDNRILNNGPRTSGNDEDARPGMRGGIVIGLSFKRAFYELFGEQEFLAPDGIPAVKIHDNIITQPLGQALFIMALGPVSVIGNQLTSQGADFRVNPLSLLAGSVFILNLGVSKDLVGWLLFPSIKNLAFTDTGRTEAFGLTTAPVPGVLLAALYMPSGNVLFSNNQTTLDLRAPEVNFALSSQLIASLDDVSYIGNQSECAALVDYVLSNTVIYAVTIRTNDNRFQEGVTVAVASLFSYGFMNTCTANQAMHCLFPLGRLWLEENNMVVLSSDCASGLEKWQKRFGIGDEYSVPQ
jgi:hypothetical protein